MVSMNRLVPVPAKPETGERRTAVRLAPDRGSVPAEVTLPTGTRLSALLKDISATGVGLSGFVPAQAAADLLPGCRVSLSIALSDKVLPYRIEAIVAHRTDDRAGLRFAATKL